MCDQTEVAYNPNDIVWVKIATVWWPAEVVNEKELDEDVTAGLRRKPLAVVKFFNEDLYEFPKNLNQIYHYNCLRKDEFIKKGLDLLRASEFRDVPYNMKKFPKDVQIAEEKTGGIPDYIDDPKFLPKEKFDYREDFGLKPLRKNRERSGTTTPVFKTPLTINTTPSPKVTFSQPEASTSKSNDFTTPGRKLSKSFKNASNTPPSILKKISKKTKKTKSEQSVPFSYFPCPILNCDFFTKAVNNLICHLKAHYRGYLLPAPPCIPPSYNDMFQESKKNKQSYFKNSELAKKTANRKRKSSPSEPVLLKKKMNDSPKKEKEGFIVSDSSSPTMNSSLNDSAKKRVKKQKNQKDDKILELLMDWDDSSVEDSSMANIETLEKSTISEQNLGTESYTEPESEIENLSQPVGSSSPSHHETPKSAEKSCFDFEDNDDSFNLDKSLKFGQKLPRVINEKQSSVGRYKHDFKPENDEKLLKDVDDVLECTRMSGLPELPPLEGSSALKNKKKSEDHKISEEKGDEIDALLSSNSKSAVETEFSEVVKESLEEKKNVDEGVVDKEKLEGKRECLSGITENLTPDLMIGDNVYDKEKKVISESMNDECVNDNARVPSLTSGSHATTETTSTSVRINSLKRETSPLEGKSEEIPFELILQEEGFNCKTVSDLPRIDSTPLLSLSKIDQKSYDSNESIIHQDIFPKEGQIVFTDNEMNEKSLSSEELPIEEDKPDNKTSKHLSDNLCDFKNLDFTIESIEQKSLEMKKMSDVQEIDNSDSSSVIITADEKKNTICIQKDSNAPKKVSSCLMEYPTTSNGKNMNINSSPPETNLPVDEIDSEFLDVNNKLQESLSIDLKNFKDSCSKRKLEGEPLPLQLSDNVQSKISEEETSVMKLIENDDHQLEGKIPMLELDTYKNYTEKIEGKREVPPIESKSLEELGMKTILVDETFPKDIKNLEVSNKKTTLDGKTAKFELKNHKESSVKSETAPTELDNIKKSEEFDSDHNKGIESHAISKSNKISLIESTEIMSNSSKGDNLKESSIFLTPELDVADIPLPLGAYPEKEGSAVKITTKSKQIEELSVPGKSMDTKSKDVQPNAEVSQLNSIADETVKEDNPSNNLNSIEKKEPAHQNILPDEMKLDINSMPVLIQQELPFIEASYGRAAENHPNVDVIRVILSYKGEESKIKIPPGMRAGRTFTIKAPPADFKPCHNFPRRKIKPPPLSNCQVTTASDSNCQVTTATATPSCSSSPSPSCSNAVASGKSTGQYIIMKPGPSNAGTSGKSQTKSNLRLVHNSGKLLCAPVSQSCNMPSGRNSGASQLLKPPPVPVKLQKNHKQYIINSKTGLPCNPKAIPMNKSMIGQVKRFLPSQGLLQGKNPNNIILATKGTKSDQDSALLMKPPPVPSINTSSGKIVRNISSTGRGVTQASSIIGPRRPITNAASTSQMERKVFVQKIKQSNPNILQKSPRKVFRQTPVNKARVAAVPSQTQTSEIVTVSNLPVVIQNEPTETAGESVLYVMDQHGNCVPNQIIPFECSAENTGLLDTSTLINITDYMKLEGSTTTLDPASSKKSGDILAEALANTQVFQSDTSELGEVDGSVYQQFPTTSFASNVVETSLTLNQPPIMSPLEVSSTVSSQASVPVSHKGKRPEIQPSMPLLTDDDAKPQSVFYTQTTSVPTFQLVNALNDNQIVVASSESATPNATNRIMLTTGVLAAGAKSSPSDITSQSLNKEDNVLPEFLRGDFNKKPQKSKRNNPSQNGKR